MFTDMNMFLCKTCRSGFSAFRKVWTDDRCGIQNRERDACLVSSVVFLTNVPSIFPFL
jgi:hypothetical protein